MSEQYSYMWLVWECSMPSRLSRESFVIIVSAFLCELCARGSSRRAVCCKLPKARVPLLLRQSGGACLGVRSWISPAMLRTGPALSRLSPAGSSGSHPVEAHAAAVTSAWVEAHDDVELRLSSSEELDVESFASEETSLSQYTANEEGFMDVFSQAVEKLSIEWPADRQESNSKIKLYYRFLSARPQPSRRCLLFFPDLHARGFKDLG